MSGEADTCAECGDSVKNCVEFFEMVRFVSEGPPGPPCKIRDKYRGTHYAVRLERSVRTIHAASVPERTLSASMGTPYAAHMLELMCALHRALLHIE